jgi:hypothetical protein
MWVLEGSEIVGNGVNDELIRKKDALDALMAERKHLLANGQKGAEHVLTHHGYNVIDELPPVQSDVPDINAGDMISKQAAQRKINALIDEFETIMKGIRERHVDDSVCGLCEYDGAYVGDSGNWCNECPGFDRDDCFKLKDEYRKEWAGAIKNLPSAQPERTCVNCGRTANNGGWYADGRTRCPIEEHYALPKDGYCHLWEKRNVTDDDYPERREE